MKNCCWRFLRSCCRNGRLGKRHGEDVLRVGTESTYPYEFRDDKITKRL